MNEEGGIQNPRYASIIRKLSQDTRVVGFRVPYIYYMMYDGLDRERQTLVREVVKSAFIKAVENISEVKIEQMQQTINVVVPIQVNVNKAEAVSGSRPVDLDVNSEYVQALEEDLRKAKKVIYTYKERLKTVRELASKLATALNYRDLETSKALLKKLLETLQG